MARYTYEQMRENQRRENAKFAGAPVDTTDDEEAAAPSDMFEPDTTAADTSDITPDVLNAPAIDDSASAAPVAPAPTPTAAIDHTLAAKRHIVMEHAIHNSPQAVEAFAQGIRRAYNVPASFKAPAEKVLQSGYRLTAAQVPNLTPEKFMASLRRVYGKDAETAILEQGKKDYPDYKDESDLIDKMYQHKIAKDETGPLSWADKAQIVARRYPELHNLPGQPEDQLRTVYDKAKANDKDNKIGSFDDWMHEQMNPTLAERGLNLGAGIVKGLADQGKSVLELGKAVLSPEQLRSDVMLALSGDEKAKNRLKEAGLGAVNLGAIAASIGTGGAVSAAEGALGAAKTAPVLAGALEGAVGGGAQGAGQAALEGKSPGEIGQSALNTSALGMILGGAAEGIPGAKAAKATKVSAAEDAAAAQAAEKAATAAEAARVAEVNKGSSLAPSKYEAALEKFGREHNLTVDESRRIIESDDALAYAPANATVKEMQDMRQLARDAAAAKAAEPAPPTEAPATTPPAEGTAPLAEDVTTKLRDALQAGRAAATEQKKLYSKARGGRIQEAIAARTAAGGGEAGSAAEKGALKGELPKVQWDAVKGTLTQENIDSLFNKIDQSDLSFYSKRTAKNGLERLLGIDDTGPPRPSELKLMGRVYGEDFVKELAESPALRQRIGSFIRQTLATPRAMMTVHGFSVFGRQGANLIGTPEWWGNLVPVARMWGSEKFANAATREIEERPTFPAMQAAGVKFNDIHAGGEEMMAESLLDRIPKNSRIGKFYRMNKRSFIGGVNKLRADSFDRIYTNAKRAGVDVADQKFLDSLGEVVNNSTGRGKMPKSMERAAEFLGQALFSPRLTASRFQNFNPLYYGTKHPAIMAEVTRQNMSAAAAGIGILGLMSLAGWKVGTDPRSADFGKARKANTRIDLFAGHVQVMRLAAQIMSGETVSSTTGKVTDLRSGKYGSKTVLDVMQQFFENKEAPIPSYLTLMAKAYSNQLGPDRRPINLGKEALDRLIPIPFGAVLHAASEWHNDPVMLTGLSAVSQLGAGVESYGPGDLQSAPPMSFKSNGSQIEVPAKFRDQFINEISVADQHATARAMAIAETTAGRKMSDDETQKLAKSLVKSERAKVLYRWTAANDSILKEHHAPGKSIQLVRTPDQAAAERLAKPSGGR